MTERQRVWGQPQGASWDFLPYPHALFVGTGDSGTFSVPLKEFCDLLDSSVWKVGSAFVAGLAPPKVDRLWVKEGLCTQYLWGLEPRRSFLPSGQRGLSYRDSVDITTCGPVGICQVLRLLKV